MSRVTLNPMNQKAADRISALLAKQPVAFVGAGLTRPAFPSWDELMQRLSANLGIPLTADLDNISQAELFFIQAQEQYRAELIAAFGTFPADCRVALKEMVKLRFTSFITTNYDYSISRAYQEASPLAVTHYCYPAVEPSDCGDQRRVFFLHGAVANGRIDNLDHFILHKSAYYKAYFREQGQGHGPLSSFFYNVYKSYDLLFVGFGFGKDEPLVRVLNIAAENRGLPHERVMLRPRGLTPPEIENYKHAYGIEIVEYDPLDEQHRGLDDIFLKLTQDRTFAIPQFVSSLDAMNQPVTSLQ